MTTKITKKIVGFAVKNKNTETVDGVTETAQFDTMNESIKRPEMLTGSTYKIKTPQSEHALYLTINDIILNEGTEFEQKHPYEIFINSKNMEHFQWVIALTRLASAVFRKGGDICFLVKELKDVFDPKGGHWEKGVFVPSLVAKIGLCIEDHLTKLNMIIKPVLEPHVIAIIEEKTKGSTSTNKLLCPSCGEYGVVVMDGCKTCLSCSWSKCS